jgi:hypothetical protein
MWRVVVNWRVFTFYIAFKLDVSGAIKWTISFKEIYVCIFSEGVEVFSVYYLCKSW